MDNSKYIPFHKQQGIEALIIKTDAIEIWVTEQPGLGILPIECSIEADRHSSEEDVEALVKVDIVNAGARKLAIPSEVPNGQHVNHILVKHVQDQIAVSSVSLSAVYKE